MRKWDTDVNSTVYKPKTQNNKTASRKSAANKIEISPHCSKFLVQFIPKSLCICGSTFKMSLNQNQAPGLQAPGTGQSRECPGCDLSLTYS